VVTLLTVCIMLLHIGVLAAASEFPMHMTDTLGWQVTIKTLPQRIVSLAPANTERLFAVGA
jgi:iron complex transport system substrate-binding protein